MSKRKKKQEEPIETQVESHARRRGIRVNDRVKDQISLIVEEEVAARTAQIPGDIDWNLIASSMKDDYGDDPIGTDSGMAFPLDQPKWRLHRVDGSVENVPYAEEDFVEVVPGVKFAKRLVGYATKGASDAVERREVEAVAKREADYAEIKADLEIASKITESLAEQIAQRKQNKEAALEILGEAIARQYDGQLAFIDITNNPAKVAAEKVLSFKEKHPGCDVEPVDLTDALKGVSPLKETNLDEVTYIMHCHRHQDVDDLPARVRFAIPSLPAEGKETTYELHAYVQLEALPPELQAVVETYIRIVGGNSMLNFDKLREQIAALQEGVDRAQHSVEFNENMEGDSTKWAKLAGIE